MAGAISTVVSQTATQNSPVEVARQEQKQAIAEHQAQNKTVVKAPEKSVDISA